MATTHGESNAVGQIYRLQAAFHRAKSTQDIDLMMSLWEPNGTLTVEGDANSPYSGFDQLKAFWQSSGSLTNGRFSLVPSFKIQIAPAGDTASLYFECHDVGNYDQPDRQIVADTFLAGTLHRAGKRFVFYDMTAGKAFPLSVDHYYFPSDRPPTNDACERRTTRRAAHVARFERLGLRSAQTCDGPKDFRTHR